MFYRHSEGPGGGEEIMQIVTLVFDLIEINTDDLDQDAYDALLNNGHAANAMKYIREDSKVLTRVSVTQSKRLESVEEMAYSAAFEYSANTGFEVHAVARLSEDQTSDSEMGVDLSL